MSEEENSASSSKESSFVAGEDEKNEEDVSVEREDEENEERDDDMPPTHWRNSGGKNPIEFIQSLQSSLKYAFDDYGMQFLDIEAELRRTKSENKELTKINNRLEVKLKRAEYSKRNFEQTRNILKEELKRVREQEESCKRNLEQTRNTLRELCTTFAAVKEKCDQACNQQDYPEGVLQLPKKSKYVLKVYKVNDFLNCQIWLEPWTQSGAHVIWYVYANGCQIKLTSISFSPFTMSGHTIVCY